MRDKLSVMLSCYIIWDSGGEKEKKIIANMFRIEKVGQLFCHIARWGNIYDICNKLRAFFTQMDALAVEKPEFSGAKITLVWGEIRFV